MSSQAPFTAALARRKHRVEQIDSYVTVKQEQKTDQDLLMPVSSIYKARGNHAQDAIEFSDSDSDTPRSKSQNIDPSLVVDLDSPSSVSNATVDIADDGKEKQHVSTVDPSKLKDDGRITDTRTEELFTKPPEVPDARPASDMTFKDDASSEPRLDAHDEQATIGINERAEPTFDPRIAAEHDTVLNIGDGAISMPGDHDLACHVNGDFQGKPITQDCDDQAVEGPMYTTPVAIMSSEHSVVDRTSEGTTAVRGNHELNHEKDEDPRTTSISHRGDQAVEQPMYKAPVAYMGPRISPKKASSLSRQFDVDSIQVDATTASARGVGLKVDNEPLEAFSEEKMQKAQETLSEMGRLMRETKRKRDFENLLRRTIEEQNIVGRRPQNTIGAGQKVHGRDPRVPSSAHPAMGHTGPSGLQIGLASLGMGNPDILQQIASNKQASIPSELGPTDEDEFVEPSMDFSSTGVRGRNYVGRMSATDLFVRGSTGSSPLGKQQGSISECDSRMQFSETTASQASPSTTKSGTAKKRATACALPTCMDECSEEDRMLLYMKEVEVAPWADIRSTWHVITGQEVPSSTLSHRYKRIKANLMELKESDGSVAAKSKGEEFAAQSSGGAPRISKKRPHGEPSIADYFERHGQRVKALKAGADPNNRGHKEKFDGQEESLFLNSDSDDNHQANTHPKTGAKGLSMETVKKWKADAQVYPTPSQSEMEQEELDFPKILYEYHVTKRIQLEGQHENQARTTGSGPYYTVAEANAVAAIKARQPNDADAMAIFRPGAWSYSYEKDDAGMETHRASGAGGKIQAWVTREIASSEENIGIPLTAFTTPSWMYIAMCSSSKRTATGDAHVTDSNEVILPHGTLSANTIIKACTLLDLANRAASREWIQLQAANIPNDGLGHIARAEMEMHMRHDLEKMDEGNVAFDRTYRNPASGLETHIWVEMVEVEGPRN